MNIGLLLALIIGSVIVWPTLPERIPIHFGFDGKADNWTDRSFWAWFILPLIAVFSSALIVVMSWLVQRRPEVINLPDRTAFLALTPARRQPVIDTLRRSMYLLAMIITIMLGIMQIGSYRTALGNDGETFMIVALGIGSVMMTLMSVVMMVSVQSKIDAQTKAARLEREGSDGKSAPA